MSALFRGLVSLLNFEFEGFEARLGGLAAEDYPSDAAPELIKYLLRELTDQRNRVSSIERDFAVDPRGAFDRLRSEHRKLNLRFPFASHIRDAQTRHVPWSLVPSIEHLGEKLVPNRSLITSCFDKFNYSIHRGETKTDPDPFDILFIPSVHRLDAFLHVEIGHELFHLLVAPFLAKEQPRVLGWLRRDCEKFLTSRKPPDRSRLDEMTELTRNVWRRAVEEIICDFGCASLFGPAALMASVSLFISSNLDAQPSPPRYYPPARFRWRKVVEIAFGVDGNGSEYQELLAALSTDEDLKEHLDSLGAFWQVAQHEISQTTDMRAIRANRITAIAYSQIDSSLRLGWKFVQEIVRSTQLSWASSIKEIPFHLRNLSLNVPCGELRLTSDPCGEPSSLPAVINAAWINELRSRKQRSTYSPTESAQDYLKACRLLLKSVEDAELKLTFKKLIAPQLEGEIE